MHVQDLTRLPVCGAPARASCIPQWRQTRQRAWWSEPLPGGWTPQGVGHQTEGDHHLLYMCEEGGGE